MNSIDVFIILGLSLIGALIFSRMIGIYKKNNDWLSLALTSIGDAVLNTDKHGNVIGLNSAAEKLTGWTLSEAKGKPAATIIRLLEHDTRNKAESPVNMAIVSGKIVNQQGNILLQTRDNSEIPIECVAAPIVARGNKIKGTVLIFRDISERYMAQQKLAESEDRLKAVTNEACIGLVMINRDRRYVYANNFYMQMIGFSDLFVLGKKVQDVLPVIYEQIKPNLDRAFAGERVTYEVKGVANKELGLNRIYSVTYEPQIRQSLVLNVVIVILDITHLKNAA